LTDDQVLQAHLCFQATIRQAGFDNVPVQSILFGSTLQNWLAGNTQIVLICEPPTANYMRAPDLG
jgi:hypothetical protein